jgi:prolyl oligopeptidase
MELQPHPKVVETMHGREIVDPYRWLEEEEDPSVEAWTEAQNARTREALDSVPGRAAIRARLQELLRIGYVGGPSVRKDRYFITRREGDQNHPVVYLRIGLDGDERVLIDPNAWSEDGTSALDWWYPSDDGRLVAYGISEAGDERSTLYVLDVDSGERLGDVIHDARACSLAWLPDGSGFYYTRYPHPGDVPEGDDNYYRRVWFHRLGDDPAKDPLIFGEGREREDWPNVDLSPDGRWMTITVEMGWVRSDVYVYDRDNPEAPPIVIAEGEEALYHSDIQGNALLVMTNSGAPRYRLYKVDLAHPERARWIEIIPEHPTRVLDSFAVIGGHLFVLWMDRALSILDVYGLDGAFHHEIPLPTLGSISSISGEWDGHEMFFGFTSFTVPPTVYRCTVGATAGPPELHLTVEADLGQDRYEVEQVTYPSKDGTAISMFIVHRKDLARDGRGPCLLGGYGGFNVSMTPGFTRTTYFWLERGGIYALPNLRGGGEYGESWHRDGMLEKKQNVFDDFIGAAEYLIREKYTSPEKLAISGGSNGGLLVGAALTQRPDLFRAVVCAVPLLDMLRYHHFRIARLWIPEYGSADDPEQFEWLYAYSPYHRVKDGTPYPAVLLMTGASDSRVDPLHARKMAARLQEATSSERPILIRVESKAGHGAGKPMAKVLEETTDSWSFITWQLGA